ncbi:LOW QUALITY PROTEIN: polycystic kidney disease 1 like 1 [Lates calcarifer]|uniref:LOW QUALITY PROTEIN: polycystic kidney disease 1 like 1 n=1 Tax=Lates calcarifer TaxID=8187 RepID=A0AAJ8AYG0_LATCA|nr:LOW QUALITY PROTEIN: polycystic kidney disease 1 like 1 [Lates calcarifer]
MFSPLVYLLISLHPVFNTRSAAVHRSGQESSPWFVGCVNASGSSFLGLYSPMGAHDLDPVTCCVRCLDEGYQVAALMLESCYCGNHQLHDLAVSECFNTSSSGGSDVRGESERHSVLHYLPAGGGWGIVALYRTEGPFLHSISLSTSLDRVQAGRTFVVEVSGNLAGHPSQPTGILSLEGQDLSHVTVEFLDTTPKGQSSHHVSLLDDGSFVMLSDWILETPGKYEINVSVSNLLSTLSSTLHLSVLQPSPDGLVISVLHGPLGAPSCIQLQQTDSDSEVMQAAYLGDPVTLQAYVGEGLATEFCWWFIHEKREENTEMEDERKGVKTACLPSSYLNWTFETEGVHMVSVNASSTSGWTQQTIHVVIVRPSVSNVKVSVLRNHLRAGEHMSVYMELLTTMKHLLVLNLTLNADYDHNYKNSKGKDNNTGSRGSIDNNSCSIDGNDMNNISNDDRGVFSDEISSNTTNIAKTESHASSITDWENSSDQDCNHSNHGNTSYSHSLNQHHSNIYCPDGTHSYPHHFIPLHLLHTSNPSSCRLHLHLHCCLPTAAGRYHLTASVFFTHDPSSVLPTVLPQALMVYEQICALRPSGSWMSVVPTHAEFSLEVVGHGNRMGSRIIWTFILDNAVMMNRTTEEWSMNVSLPVAGRYNVTVKALNPVSWSSFQTHILVQDLVGELALNVPSVIRTNQKHSASFSVSAGSNMTLSLLVNATLLYRNSSYATGEEAAVVLLLNHTGTVAVELRAENRVSSQKKSVRVCVKGNRKPSPQVRVNPNWQPPTSQSPAHSLCDNVWIYAAKQAYPTNTDITLLAVSDAPDLVEFIWHFGDSTSVRTTSRNITKRYNKPGRFDVVVVMSGGQSSVPSEVFPLVIQRAVKLNRLVHQPSVLQNQTATVSCRVNVGTNLTFLWSFGDGSSRLGQSTEQHVFHKTGEFRVEVTVSNLVSSASLSSHVFVVDRPCQPPPVKNMGPLKLQVRRYEVICLGVTFETEFDCDISGGLQYTWTLFDSAGQTIPLPFTDTHRQSLTLQSHLLHYDTYTAIARVQVIGNVVYSNYSVRVHVMPSPPVAFIQGGTNIFINNRNTTTVTLDGQRSYDPDFPMNPLSYSWTCKPLSSITTSCFTQHVTTSSPVLTFPVSFLKHNFDQFQFTLTVHSGERSASSETFLTVIPDLLGKVSVYCAHCQGDQVNWDQSFSASTLCEDCDVSTKHIQYSWSLYLVDASSRPVIEVPFCYTVDLGAPSTIIKGPASSPQTPGTSTPHPSDPDTSDYTRTVYASAPVLLAKPRARKQTLGLADSGTSSQRSRNMSNKAGDKPFYHSLGKLDPAEHHPSTEYPPLALDNSGVLYSEHSGQSDATSKFPVDSDSSAEWEFSLPVLENGDVEGQLDSDYDVPFPSAEEGDSGISAGRPIGVDRETLSPGEDSVFDPAVHEDEGSNLVLPRPSVVIQEPTLLDLPRYPVDRVLFESYTYTGISSSVLSFRPFSLKPGSRYMLEVSAKFQNSVLGRTQLFVKTKPAPQGMMCQVQPDKGMELHTHFSIFCTSGKEDLLYEHSFSVGGRHPRVLYKGRDFQYYFNLPSGDPSDDYKVTIYTEIRSSTYGTATKPCPVTVRVQPSFLRDTSSHHDPDLVLSGSGLRNLSALVRLGNSREILNYVSLLSSILNRLSLHTEANTHAQRHVRSVLICIVCELESSEQALMDDSICTLEDLLKVTDQVTLASARRVTVHVQDISDLFLESTFPAWNHLNHKTLNSLVTVLSYILQAAVTNHDFTPETPNIDNITHVLESDSPTGENIRNTIASPDVCIPASSTGVHFKRGGSVSTKQMAQLVGDTLQTASDLILKYILFHKVQEHRVSSGFITLYATFLNQTSTVISSGSTTFYLPASLIQLLFARRSGQSESRQRRPCVLSVLTELDHSPYTCTHCPTQLSGPVVDLSLYKCSVRREIPVRSLVQPISAELRHPPRNRSPVHEYLLLRMYVNYHSFNITHDHLQQAIQLSVVFTPPPKKMFPIMLLFRMFERPTASMHHLHRIHHWESNTICITLPPSYLNAAGVGHLALLNADFGKATRHKHLSEQISYSLSVVSSQCLSWDSHQGAWTHHGCRTQQVDSNTAVNCSCHQLRPLTVVQHQIQSSHDTADLDPFLSVSHDLTVLGVLVVCVCLYIPGLVVCKTADDISKKNRRVHYLSDNSPCDSYLYAVTIHTGLCSAANMSAKVYIVLYGEDGFSHTRELQVPGCTLFRRNSQDTFILSAADSLGSVWGVHIWHDSSGPSPHWYLRHVEVSEGIAKGRAWLFVAQCWLAVNKGDGQVERMLHVCTRGVGFAKMLWFKLSNYLADFHIWISVYRCPCPNLFTHTQRLSVCLLLLLGYACVNTVIISQMDDQLPFELGILDVSAVSVTTGVLSVMAVLPGATMISFLFRLHEVKLMSSGVRHAKSRKSRKDCFEDALSVNDSVFHLSWSCLQQWIQEVWRKKNQDTDVLSVSTTILENKDTDKESVIKPDMITGNEDGLAVESSMGLGTRKHADQGTQRKEFDVLVDNKKSHGTQKDLLSSYREEDQTIQEEKEEPQGKCPSDCGSEEGSHHQAEWSGHGSGCHVIDKLKGRRVGPASPWCHYLAWVLCLLLSLSCLVLSAVLGMRFTSSKVLLWIHSLSFSLMSCIFFIQPAVILTVAVTVSFWYRKRPDFHSFSRIKECDIEASTLCSHRGASPTGEQFRTSAFPQEECLYLKKLLATRQRARYLRLVHPLTPAELRRSRGRKRRETLIHNSLRDLSVCVSMALLMLSITYGSSFTDHYHLNKAVRKQFIRNDGNDFMSIQNHKDWWKWTQTSLLNLLYKNASVKTEQSHILIGEPILWKTEVSKSFQGQLSSVTLGPESLHLRLLGSNTSTYPHSIVMVPTATLPRTCGHLGCYSGLSTTVGLGHTKSDAASKLNLLHSSGWLGRQTVALKVQFTLFSPAPNLFTSVTLLTEQSPTNVLLPSSKVLSVRVYHTAAVWDYVVMACQLLFLLLSLLQLCHQMCAMRQQGLMGYWRKPCNWLEVTVLTVTLVYYIYYIYHSTIIMHVVELLQTHRGHVDVSFLATWEQNIRSLRGVTLFLLTMKCVTVLRVNRTLATSATLLTSSLSSLFWPMISGLILLVALSCAGNLVFVQSSWAFSSIPHSLQTLLRHCWGLRSARDLLLSGHNVLYCATLYLSSTVVWTAVVIGVMSSLVRDAKRSQGRRDVFTVAELAGYIRRRISEFTGQREPTWVDNHVERRTYYLEEFESLVDELLFRLNALSNSLHHTLPPTAHHYMEPDSPIASSIQELSSMDMQDFVDTQMTEETIEIDHTDVSGCGRTLPASHLLRSKHGSELQQRGQQRNNSFSDIVLASDNLQENPNDRGVQTHLRGQISLSLPESASLITIWTDDALEKQTDQWTKTNDSCWLSTTQATHTEVVVEVLVHDEPGSVEPGKQEGQVRLAHCKQLKK